MPIIDGRIFKTLYVDRGPTKYKILPVDRGLTKYKSLKYQLEQEDTPYQALTDKMIEQNKVYEPFNISNEKTIYYKKPYNIPENIHRHSHKLSNAFLNPASSMNSPMFFSSPHGYKIDCESLFPSCYHGFTRDTFIEFMTQPRLSDVKIRMGNIDAGFVQKDFAAPFVQKPSVTWQIAREVSKTFACVIDMRESPK